MACHSHSARSRWAAFVVIVLLAGTAGGCAFQLVSMKGEDKTGSTVAALTDKGKRGSGDKLAEGDLAIARAAASEVLARGGKDASLPWENPETGARGTVTPIASAYTQDGFVCRDFLASYVKNGSEAWIRGEACRLHKGRWEVRALKPWQRT
jgi:surface antigen